jgi:Raf kinase inhibitor-like YbhB/YbcL family protein
MGNCIMNMRQLIGVIMCSATLAAQEKLQLDSLSFKNGGHIPQEYTCNGQSKAPQLSWSGSPADTKSFALIMDDPDAPSEQPWVHWVVFNIPATTSSLDKPLGRKRVLPNGSAQGTNSSKKIGYDGPCPPPGEPHHYHIKLYALDTTLDLEGGATKDELLSSMRGHILDQAEIVGTYQR